MKKLILSLSAVALFAVAANAQIEQGTIHAGVMSNLEFSSTSQDGVDDNATNFNVDLRGGYFFMENLVGGLIFGYDSYKQGESDGSSTTIGLYGRYYVNGTIFVGAGYESTSVKDSDYNDAMLPLEVGYAAFITDDITVEPSLSYSMGMGDNEANTFGFNIGFGLYLR